MAYTLKEGAAKAGDWLQRIQAFGWFLSASGITGTVLTWTHSAAFWPMVGYSAGAGGVGVAAWAVSSRKRVPPPLPSAPNADSSLAMLRDMGFRFDRPQSEPTAPRLTWHQLEERFKNVQGEVETMWQREDVSGKVSWYVYARPPHTQRTVERFLNEARIAGRMLAEAGDLPRRFPDQHFEDYADDWLNVVAALVGPEPHITGSGNDERGTYKSAFLDKTVDASQVACGRLATAAITGVPVTPKPPKVTTASIAALLPYEKAGRDLQTLAQAQVDHVQQLLQAPPTQASAGHSPVAEPPAAELPKGLVQLSWHQDVVGLHIDATNLRPEVILDFKLWVTDVRKYSDTNNTFVQVEFFHESPELQLWSETKTQATQIGGLTKLFCGSPVTFAFLYRDANAIWFKGRTRDASIEQPKLQTADVGVWEVTLRCEVGDRARTEKLMFAWPDAGRAPTPWSFPAKPVKLVSDAPEPPTILSGRAAVSGSVRESESAKPDPNAKDQAFADVLTERYSFALHGIMNWGRLAKGADFTEADSREWDDLERNWTDEVRELLKAHGCNAQIQAHFRDLHEVPYNQFHHFRYMSERLSMFSLRLKRLKSIINHYANVPILD
jgi:hypothetical protein